jgi:hypothetical protein
LEITYFVRQRPRNVFDSNARRVELAADDAHDELAAPSQRLQRRNDRAQVLQRRVGTDPAQHGSFARRLCHRAPHVGVDDGRYDIDVPVEAPRELGDVRIAGDDAGGSAQREVGLAGRLEQTR